MSVARRVVLCAVFMLVTIPAWAQLPSASIRGVIRDAQEGVLPGTTVTVTQKETGLTRTTTTNEEGTFRIAGLPSGVYDIVAELSGFTKANRSVELVLNQEAEINISLGVNTVSETIQVVAESPLISTTRSEVSRTFKAEEIRDLPLPGRNYLNLMLNVPGATTGGTGAAGFGVAVNGQRPRQVNFIIDGSDNNDASVNGTRSPVIQDAVGEFRIVTSLFSAEMGRNTGAVAIATTKSGTNQFHGTAFEFYEDAEKLNARTNVEIDARFDKPGKLRRDIYGGTVGGPIVPSRMFFFGAYQRTPFEGRGAATSIPSVTAEGRAQLATIPGVDRRMLELMNTYIPVPNAGATRTTTVGGVAIPFADYIATLPNSSLNNQFVTRVDMSASTTDSIYGRYIYSKNESIGASSPPGFANDSVFPTHNVVGVWNRTLGSAMLNELHVSYGRTGGLFPGGSTNPAGNNDLPTISVQGLWQIGLAVNIPQDRKEQVVQFTDSLSYLRGNHAFKFGADVRRIKLTSFVPFDFRGTFTYTGLQTFLFNQPATVQRAYGDPGPVFDYYEQGYFAQDDWKITPTVTLNLGLRYERVGAAQDFYSNVKTDNNNIGPRAGFAWDLTGDGKTLLRGGYGLTYDQFFLNLPLLTFQSPPFQRRVTVFSGLTYPNVPGDREITPAERKTLNILDIPDDARSPYAHVWQVGIQRELFGSWRAEAAYVGTLGRNLIRQRVENPLVCCPRQTVIGPTGATAARRFGDPTQTGQITVLESAAKSEYHAGQFALERRLSKNFSLSAAYTWSRFMDDASESLATGTPTLQRPQNNFDFDAEWSRSAFDRPHRLVVSGLYMLPFLRAQEGVLGRALGGWQVSWNYSIQSGQPFTVITGVDSNGDGDTANDRPNVGTGDPKTIAGYIMRPSLSGCSEAAASCHGNLGRNTGRAPTTKHLNAVLFKNFRTVGAQQLQFRAEFFNVLNRRNYVLLGTGRERNLSIPDQFYNFTSSNGGSRTVILGLKYIF